MGAAADLVEGAYSTLVLGPEDPWIGDKDVRREGGRKGGREGWVGGDRFCAC